MNGTQTVHVTDAEGMHTLLPLARPSKIVEQAIAEALPDGVAPASLKAGDLAQVLELALGELTSEKRAEQWIKLQEGATIEGELNTAGEYVRKLLQICQDHPTGKVTID